MTKGLLSAADIYNKQTTFSGQKKARIRQKKTLQINLLQIYQSHDILLLNETWTSDLRDVSIEGFEHMILNCTEKKPGTKRNSGGLVVYIKSELFDENTYSNWMEMTKFGSN